MPELTWSITSSVDDLSLFEGFYNDHRLGKGCVNCVPIYRKHVEFSNKAFAISLCRTLNAFDPRDFRVIETPAQSYKDYIKRIDDQKGWEDVR